METTDLTPAAQDYLKVIWSAQEWNDKPVTTTMLAQTMGFSPSTVSEAIKKLTEQGLVTHPRYGTIDLSDRGQRIALSMVRRHRLIETFLVDYLGYRWDEVHDEAEILEHAVSDDFVERLGRRLGEPARDPHGDPIPSVDGLLPDLPALLLSGAPTGERMRVARVSDADPDLLRHLAGLGLGLDTVVTVTALHDYAGTVSVTVEADDGSIARTLDLGLTAAEAIRVVPV